MTSPSPWQSVADALAAWAWSHLVNRTDVWGAYLPPDRRAVRTRADGSTYALASYTAPAVAKRGRVLLTPGRLALHFRAVDAGNLIGLHTTAPGNTSRWGAIEVDRHGDGGDPDANFRAALFWRDALVSLGFCPILSDSNGRGGYHLRVIFDRPAPTARVHSLLQWITRDYREQGLATAPETFPKQPSIEPGRYGNWLRLWGRHHTRDHFTRLRVDDDWIEGRDAADVILRHVLDSPDLIPEIPDPAPATPAARPRRSHAGDADDKRRVALFCLDAIANGGEGAPYDTWIAVGMALHSVDASAAMLAEWIQWSRQSGKFIDGEAERKWRSFSPGGGITLGTLVALARQAGREPFANHPRSPSRTPRRRPHAATELVVASALPDPPEGRWA